MRLVQLGPFLFFPLFLVRIARDVNSTVQAR